MRCVLLSWSVVVGLGSLANAAGPQFHWKKNQVLEYSVEQVTNVSDTAEGKTESTNTRLNLRKRWLVQDVDANGVATLQLSLLSLRMELGKNSDTPITFDSGKVDPVNAELNKEMLQYIGKPIAILRLDSFGRLIDVKESHFGPASRYATELPFRLTMPAVMPGEGQSWERTFQIKLEPPQGAGETYNAAQRFTCKSVTASVLTVGLSTTIKELPEAATDRIPLLSMQPAGTVTFDLGSGRMKKADLRMEAEVADHRGPGSKYKFLSTYVESLIEQ